jgi:PAS domain S-box-containing protein
VKFGLSKKIIITIETGILIAAILFSILVYLFLMSSIKKDINIRLEIISSLKIAYIKQYLNFRISEIEDEVKNNHVKTKLVDFLESKSEDNGAMALDLLMDDLLKIPGLLDLYILNNNGVVVLSSDRKNEGKIKSGELYFLKAKEKTVIQSFRHDISHKQIITVMATPIKDNNSVGLGILVIEINAIDINNLMTDRSGLGETGETFLVNSFNFVVTDLLKEKDATLKKALYSSLINSCLEKKSNYFNQIDYHGDKVFGYARYFPEIDSCLISKIDKRELIRPILQVIPLFILFVLLVCLLVSVFGYFVSKSILNPLRVLRSKAIKIKAGASDVLIEKMSNDEIGDLALSFKEMLAVLEQSRQDLENKVIERTKKLKQSEEALKTNLQKLQEYNIEIKNSRNHLKTERNKLRQYLDTAGVIVLIFDFNNSILLVNKKGCEILGAKDSEIVGRDWVSEFVVKKNQVQTKNLLASLINNTATTGILENSIIAKDKSERNVTWRFSLLESERDTASTILATGVDITELTKAKITIGQLKEVDRLKSEVLNVATHELKTPLISIVGLSEVMAKQPKTIPADYQSYISIIHDEGTKLSNLIKTMLTASRNEIGKAAAVKEKFDLVELVESMKTSLSMLSKRTDSQVRFDLRVKGIKLESDKAKISEVIYNFVDNAVKYGPKNQTIDVNLFLPDDKSVKIEVKGAGHGISKAMQKKLFMKFSQLEPSLSRSQDGMGLGLYICKQNIENLGGQIGVESDLDKGATFYFTLPLTSKIKI